AHRDTDLGIGDRATEVLLPERSFAALKALLLSDEFTRIRPYQPGSTAASDAVQAARVEGPSPAQSFHEQVRSQRSRYRPITKDIVAFANTNGGTIYVGVTANPTQPVTGVPNAEEAARALSDAIARSVVPKLTVPVEVTTSAGQSVLIVTVPKGENTPYATDAGQVFVRQGSETVVALRDEIVQLVRNVSGTAPAPAIAPAERAWTAVRPADDADDEADDLPASEAHGAPVAETAETPAEERRAPRRRRSRRRTTDQPDAAAGALPPEPEAAPIPDSAAPPETVVPPNQPVTEDTTAESLAAAEPATRLNRPPRQSARHLQSSATMATNHSCCRRPGWRSSRSKSATANDTTRCAISAAAASPIR
ncbi:MAG: ATP-binding protein, partial [Thermomicrobia bacterium]|nr:ATP-binding protein [Thermomicrobia bacterium]